MNSLVLYMSCVNVNLYNWLGKLIKKLSYYVPSGINNSKWVDTSVLSHYHYFYLKIQYDKVYNIDNKPGNLFSALGTIASSISLLLGINVVTRELIYMVFEYDLGKQTRECEMVNGYIDKQNF